jgi:amidase
MRIEAILGAAQRLGLVVSSEEAAMAAAMLAGLAHPKAAKPAPPRNSAGRDALGAVVCEIPEREAMAGPLAGNRLAVKDNIAVAGVPTAIGSGLPGFIGDADAMIVARAAGAGAVLRLKAQCEAFLLGANSYSSQPAPVRNPLDSRRSAGGSSSGSAALVAAGLCDMALGTDSAGSIRIPAAYCGIVGLKPGRGVVPFTGIAPLAPWLECAGPMARSVGEVADLYREIAGQDGIDPRQIWASAPVALPPPASIVSLRIGMLEDAFEQCAPPLRDILTTALKACGARLASCIWPYWDEALAHHSAIYLASEAATARGSEALLPQSDPPGWAAWNAALDPASLPRLKQFTLMAGTALLAEDPAVLARSMATGETLARSLDALFAETDVLALPTTRSIAPLIPADPTPEEVFGDTALTSPFNLTGHPAISLPVGLSEGMPIGLQLIGRRGGEAHLIACAALIEAALAIPPLPIPELQP